MTRYYSTLFGLPIIEGDKEGGDQFISPNFILGDLSAYIVTFRTVDENGDTITRADWYARAWRDITTPDDKAKGLRRFMRREWLPQ